MAFEVFIEPGRSEKNYWKDLWRYRELFYILSWRDLKVDKNTDLLAWYVPFTCGNNYFFTHWHSHFQKDGKKFR
jgi:hypothetical protein